MSTTTKFVAVYDGPDHADHEIDIMTFGHSLTSLGALLYEANETLNGERASIQIRINAEFIEGSFGVAVDLIQHLPDAKDILVPLGLMGASVAAGSVAGVIQWLKGADITAIEEEKDGKESIYVNGDHITCEKDISLLVSNPRVRQAFEGLVRAPLLRDGTTSVAFKRNKDDKQPALLIGKDDASSFTRLSFKQDEEFYSVDARVKFVAANVRSKSGWKMIIDRDVLPVKMEDNTFRQRLENMEENYVFGRRFDVILRIKEVRTTDRVVKKYWIDTVRREV